jgi:hypothetical protein
VKVERVLGDRLEKLGLVVLWTDTTRHFSFNGKPGDQRAYFEGVERSGPHTRGWFHLLLDYARVAYPMLMCESHEPWLRAVVRHQHAFEAAYRLGGHPALLEAYAALKLVVLLPENEALRHG